MDFTSSRPEDLLFDAARRGDVATIKALLAEGTGVNTQDGRGYTALILAAYDNHIEAVRVLLEAGADPNRHDASGNTALMGVSFKGFPEIASCSSTTAPT